MTAYSGAPPQTSWPTPRPCFEQPFEPRSSPSRHSARLPRSSARRCRRSMSWSTRRARWRWRWSSRRPRSFQFQLHVGRRNRTRTRTMGGCAYGRRARTRRASRTRRPSFARWSSSSEDGRCCARGRGRGRCRFRSLRCFAPARVVAARTRNSLLIALAHTNILLDQYTSLSTSYRCSSCTRM